MAKVEELLARVDAGRERLDRVPKIMKRFRQAVLAAACSGRLTEGWREATKSEAVSSSLHNGDHGGHNGSRHGVPEAVHPPDTDALTWTS